METLPSELSQRIFSTLNHRHLASAAMVCRTWRSMTGHEELWRKLYLQRWGRDRKAKPGCRTLDVVWKSAYEIQDRSDRVGKAWTIVREGNRIYTTRGGALLRFVAPAPNGCLCNSNPASCSSDTSSPGAGAKSRTSKKRKGKMEEEEEQQQLQLQASTSNLGVLDVLLEFVADLHNEQRLIIKKSPRIN